MKVGILTGGGDCPGLNPVIRGVVQTIANAGGSTVGMLEGWRGAVEGNTIDLTPENTNEILWEGGTMLGSSRTNPYKEPKSSQRVMDTFTRLGLDALVAIGGDDTLGVLTKLYDEFEIKGVGCPKTIDNDLSATDYTFGFDTAINIVMEAADRLRTTAKSHRRVIVVECMGRNAGWITAFSGIASGADAILIPEEEADLDEVCDLLKKRREAGKLYGLVFVSEGAKLGEKLQLKTGEVDEFGHERLGGLGDTVAKYIEDQTGIQTRSAELGHLQRGGTPTAFDRILGTRLGIDAAKACIEGDFGKMVALRGLDIVRVPLAEATGENRTLDMSIMEQAREFLR